MDPITAAIIAVLSASMAEVSKKGVLDAYDALKSLLSKKFGSHSQVVKAVEGLEKNPGSQTQRAVLQRAVAKANADQDPQLLDYANYLSQQVNSTWQQPGGDAFYVPGSGSIAKAGRDVNYGRPGLIVLLAIVLVAIFAFLIWQLFSSDLRPFANPTPTPTPTPVTATPQGTLDAFCLYIPAGGSNYAYGKLYSDTFKQQVSATDFQQQWGFFNHMVMGCTSAITNSSDKTATGKLALTVAPTGQEQTPHDETYDVTLVKDSQGQWKIDSMKKE